MMGGNLVLPQPLTQMVAPPCDFAWSDPPCRLVPTQERERFRNPRLVGCFGYTRLDVCRCRTASPPEPGRQREQSDAGVSLLTAAIRVVNMGYPLLRQPPKIQPTIRRLIAKRGVVVKLPGP